MKRKAFTLIELLVVIAIIAILAAILFPVFATAREKARQTSCASNEKQLGLGFIQYVQDYDEKFPGFTWASAPSHPGGAMAEDWAVEIYPYMKSTGVYACPDDPTTPQTNWGGFASNVGVPVSYAYNEALIRTDTEAAAAGCGTAPMGIGGASSELSSPAATVLLTEVTGDNDCVNPSASTPYGNSYAEGTLTDGVQVTQNWNTVAGTYLETGTMAIPFDASGTPKVGRHTSGSNFLLCDGHVKWLRGTVVSNGDAAAAATDPESSPCTAVGTGDLSSGNFAITFSPI